MKKFEVTIVETSEMVVEVEAESWLEAEEMVEEGWSDGKYILGSDHFVGADFKTVEKREEE